MKHPNTPNIPRQETLDDIQDFPATSTYARERQELATPHVPREPTT